MLLTFVGLAIADEKGAHEKAADEKAADEKADEKKSAEQLWFGTLNAGDVKLRLLVKLMPADKGVRGVLVSVDQGKAEIPLDEIVLDTKRLKLRVTTIKAVYDGELNSSGTEVKGTWTQLGRSMKLTLRRVEKIPEPPQPTRRNRPQTLKPPFPCRSDHAKVEITQEGAAPIKRPTSDVDSVANRLSMLVPKLRSEKKLIGLAAMIMVDGKVLASAVDGERKLGSGISLEIGDRWHLGSITKSVTATMIARLVEQKLLTWTTSVGECFEESMSLHADWQDVRLEQLLTHSSGAPANFSLLFQLNRSPEGDKRVKSRKHAVSTVLTNKPQSEPGSSFAYSNVGFTIAAAMAEEKTGTPWEELVRKEVFAPLNLASAGFGPPKDGAERLDEPRGHQKLGPLKRAVGVSADNTPIIGPAGSVHMTLAELCAFGNEHLQGERGTGTLLTAKTYRRLHTPELKNYAYGWVVPTESEWSDESILWHNGSNTMWYAMLVLIPNRKAVVAVTSNDGDIKSAEAAAIEIVKDFAK